MTRPTDQPRMEDPMSQPDAITPLTMTAEREHGDRSEMYDAPLRYACIARRAYDELDATRALVATLREEHQACPACGEAYLRAGELQVQIDALREVSACRAALEELGYTGSLPVGVYEKLADERSELAAANAALFAENGRLRGVLTECVEHFDNRSDVDDGPDGQPVPNAAMRMLQVCEAALAPQGAGEGNDA